MSVGAEQMLALPGPSAFVREVDEDVRSGRSVVIVVPGFMVDDGSAEDLVTALLRATGALDCPLPDNGCDLPGTIARNYGADNGWRRSADPWRDLAGWPAWHGQRVLLRSWEQEIGVLLRRWPALLQEGGLPEPDRPVLVMVVRRSDVEEGKLDHLDELTVRVHWWWGVIDRLDTEVHLARRERRGSHDPLRRAMITEVSAWSLDLAEWLSATWNGRIDGLVDALKSYSAQSATEDILPSNAGGRSSFPSAADRDAWDAGLIEQWDGRRRAAPWSVMDQPLDNLIWRAQSRVLMPGVDEGRAELERAFRRRANQSVIEEITGRGDVLELGPMRWALNAFGIRLDRTDAQRLTVLCRLRNRLAHGQPADDALMALAAPHLDAVRVGALLY